MAATELTSLKVEEWRTMMDSSGYSEQHPAQAEEVITGLISGMDIGFTGNRSTDRECTNLRSATDDPRVEEKVTELLMVNVTAGKTAGPFDHKPFPFFSVSPIGAVDKKPAAGVERLVTDIRVIHHLSHPFGGDSINNWSFDIYVKLGSFDAAMAAVLRAGRGCFMTKLDIKSAYRLIPVRAEDWPLLGFRWRGKYYYERTLPFGLKSSCRQWDAYATALHHAIVVVIGVGFVVHYVDDYLLIDVDRDVADRHLLATELLCTRIGMPLAHEKTEGPTTRLTFLGIELNTMDMTARLSDARLAQFQLLLLTWDKNKLKASINQLQSLTGVLQWVCKVVRPGRAFMHRIIAHTSSLDSLHPHTECTIPYSVRLDIAWWSEYAPEFNGISLLYENEWSDATLIELYTDACNTGFGARYENRWIAGLWSQPQKTAAMNSKARDGTRLSMPYLELLALLLAVATWAPLWSGRKITFRSDCQPVVEQIQGLKSGIVRSMALIRTLHTLAARHRFDFRCIHISGVTNVDADLLSRGDIQAFLDRNNTCEHPSTVNASPDVVGILTPTRQ